MRNCKIHNVRFYKPKPETITCMSLHKRDKLLALSRFDASIEIWNLNYTCFLERRIVSTAENYSIEGIAWCQQRLFTVGLHGLLFEYDISELRQKHMCTVTGGAAYCLDVNRNQNEIAIGTEQGYLNIFSITEDGVIFSKFLDKQEGSIICLKYDHTGKFIASGSPDAIRVWDVTTGHALHKMTTGRSEANKQTMVWCIEVMSDLTIISGDSRGKLTFWDGNIGSQIESYQSHHADVAALCISEDENSLFCAGVDPVITHYVRINVKDDKKKWVKSIQRIIHDHDVRALVLSDEKLYSGGVDSYLACSYFPPKTILKFPQLLQNPCAILARQTRYIMLRYANYIEIWSLGSSETKKDTNIGLLPLDAQPKKLAVIFRTVKVDNKERKEGINCCAISDNGKYVVYSHGSRTRLFQFEYEEGLSPELKPVENFECNSLSHQAVFTPSGSQLILVLPRKIVQILTLENDYVADRQDLNISKDVEDTVIHSTVSTCNRYLVLADTCSNIAVYVSKSGKWSKYCKLPKYKAVPTALAIQPHTLNLVIAYADNKITEYDLENREFSDFSRSFSENLPNRWLSRNYPIQRVTFDPKNKNVIILHDDSNIIIIDKKKILAQSISKVPKLDDSGKDNSKTVKSFKYNFHYLMKYKHLAHLDWLGDDEVVAVEVTPLSISQQLPPCLIKKKFGEK